MSTPLLIRRTVNTLDADDSGAATNNWQDYLQGDALTMALLIDIVRADGTIIALTTHDEDIVVYMGEFDGAIQTYVPMNSITASALRQELGQGNDNLDIYGILSSDLITKDDMRAGRYDGALVSIRLINYEDADLDDYFARSMPSLLIARGTIGSVSIVDSHYTATMQTLMRRMQQIIGRIYSPSCDVLQFGDARCGLDRTTFQFSATCVSITDRKTMEFTVTNATTADYYTEGRLIVSSGDNSGLAREVKTHTVDGSNALIVLKRAFPFALTTGDTFTLEAGCDRTVANCSAKFSNIVNFRGFPTIPGNQTLTDVGRPPDTTNA